jgi:hypothetical protein
MRRRGSILAGASRSLCSLNRTMVLSSASNLNRRRARPGSFGGVAECTGSSKAGSFQGCDLESCGPLVPLWEKDRALAGKYGHSTHVSASHLITQVAVAQGQGP